MAFKEIQQVVYKIKEDSSLADFLEHIKNCPKNIHLIIHTKNKWKFLHSITGIKQIIKATEKIKLSFVTKDGIAKKMIKSFNLEILESIPKDAKCFFEELFPKQKFTQNKVGKAFEKQSFEVIKVIQKNSEDQLVKAKEKIQEMNMKNKVLLAVAAVFCISIIFFLIALILPSASITISPQKKNIETVVNINYIKTDKDYSENLKNKGNNFYVYPIELRFEDDLDFPVLSKIFEGQNAEGVIKLYNSYSEPITIKKGTRIQTHEGLIFLTKHYVQIPAKKKVKNKEGKEELKPGEAGVEVKASDLDLYQEVIGARGNIPPQNFFIPGLTSYMQKFIWGESSESFKGGTTRWRREIKESDLEAARFKINSVLFENAEAEIAKHISAINKKSQKKIRLLPIDSKINKEVSKIVFPEDILGKNLETFPVNGEMLVTAFVFYENDFHNFIHKHLNTKKDPLMKIEKLDLNTLTYRKFNETPSEVRVAVGIKGRQSYLINDKSEEGKSFQTDIKNHIRGMRLTEAVKWLNNHHYINSASVKIFPPIKKHLPLVRENIEILEK